MGVMPPLGLACLLWPLRQSRPGLADCSEISGFWRGTGGRGQCRMFEALSQDSLVSLVYYDSVVSEGKQTGQH